MNGPRASDSADVVVIGGGVVGAATARSLARRGASVALLEQGSLAEAEGSSRGTATDHRPRPVSGRRVPRARDAGAGGVARARDRERRVAAHPLRRPLRGRGDRGVRPSWERVGVEIERLSPAGAQTRFGFTGIDADPLLFQREAGVLRADRAWRALLEAAEAEGVQLCEREAALEIAVRRRALRGADGRADLGVRAGGARRRAVDEVARGRLGIELPLEVSSQSVAYFEPPPGLEPACRR